MATLLLRHWRSALKPGGVVRRCIGYVDDAQTIINTGNASTAAQRSGYPMLIAPLLLASGDGFAPGRVGDEFNLKTAGCRGPLSLRATSIPARRSKERPITALACSDYPAFYRGSGHRRLHGNSGDVP